MTELGTGRVILEKTSSVGFSYVEIYDDDRVRAGYYKDTAKLYGSADIAHTRFKQSFEESGNHSAWNICDALENYMAQRDDGR